MKSTNLLSLLFLSLVPQKVFGQEPSSTISVLPTEAVLPPPVIPEAIFTGKYARLIAEGLEIVDLYASTALSGGSRLEKKVNKTCLTANPKLPGNVPFPKFSENTIDTSPGVGQASDCINMLYTDVIDVFNKSIIITMNICEFDAYTINTLVPCGPDSINTALYQCGALSDMKGGNFIWLANFANDTEWVGTVYTDDVGANNQFRPSLDLCKNLPVDDTVLIDEEEEASATSDDFADNSDVGSSGTQSSDASKLLSLLAHIPLIALMGIGFLVVY